MESNVDPKTAMAPGAKVSAVVISVDGERRRISLSARTYQRDLERQEYRKHMNKGSDQSTMTGFGQQLANALGKKIK